MNAVLVLRRGRSGGIVRVALCNIQPARKEGKAFVSEKLSNWHGWAGAGTALGYPIAGLWHPEQSLLSSHPFSTKGVGEVLWQHHNLWQRLPAVPAPSEVPPSLLRGLTLRFHVLKYQTIIFFLQHFFVPKWTQHVFWSAFPCFDHLFCRSVFMFRGTAGYVMNANVMRSEINV